MSLTSATRHGAKYQGNKDKIEDISCMNWPDREIMFRNKARDIGIWEYIQGTECMLTLAVVANKDNASKQATAKLVLNQSISKMITFIYESLSKNDKTMIETFITSGDLLKLWTAIRPKEVVLNIFNQEESLGKLEVSNYNNLIDFLFEYHRKLQQLYSTQGGKEILKEEVAVYKATR